MATFKATIGRLRADDTYPVRIRVIHSRGVAYIPTDIYVSKQYVRKSKKSGMAINDYRVLDKCKSIIRRYMRICDENDLRWLDVKGVVALIKAKDKDDIMSLDFAEYVRREAENMKKSGHAGTAASRMTAINAFCRAFGCDVIPLSSLTRKRVRDALCLISGNRAPSLYKAQLQAAQVLIDLFILVIMRNTVLSLTLYFFDKTNLAYSFFSPLDTNSLYSWHKSMYL